MSQQKAAEIGKTWYQGKRVPLYVVVAGSLAGAAYFLTSRTKHPLVEASKDVRKHEVPQTLPGADAAGQNQHESVGRRATRSMNLHGEGNSPDPQTSDGILRNKKSKDLIQDTPLDFSKDKSVTKPKV